MYINRVELYGNLTRDPEQKALPSGQAVANFSVATNREWKDKDTGKKQEQVEYHNCVAFGRTAEVIAQYLKKGRPIHIEGRLQTRTWDKDGVKHYRTEVVVDRFQFGPSLKDGAASGSSSAPAHEDQPLAKEFDQSAPEETNPDDIPF